MSATPAHASTVVSPHGPGNLYVCEGTINAERDPQVQLLLQIVNFFFKDGLFNVSHTMSNHNLHAAQWHKSVTRVWVLN